MRKFIVGSRASELALVQTNEIISMLTNINSNITIEIAKIVTKGDKILNKTLSKIGGKGLFVKEIEDALLKKKIDFAVHSMKDLPGEMPEGLVIAAISQREDFRDCFLSRSGLLFHELPSGSKIGTSSLRRQSQVLAMRPDLVIESLRGNIHTRIRKMNEGNFDAIILAVAGLKRMGWMNKITQTFSSDEMLPSAGQGALAIQCREEDVECVGLLQQIHDEDTSRAVNAERAFLRALDGDCHLPIAALGQVTREEVHLFGLVAAKDGKKIISSNLKGSKEWAIGQELAQDLICKGAEALLKEADSK